MKISSAFVAIMITSSAFASDPSVCQGKIPKYTPKAIVRVTYPDTKGLPLDKAARIKTEHMEVMRDTLKKNYFYGQGMTSKLNDLTQNYTFRFPLDVVKKVFHAETANYWQHYGYDFDSGAWQASVALDNADFLWSNYVYRETQVQEVARESGEVVFEISLNMDLFCKTSVARNDLISH